MSLISPRGALKKRRVIVSISFGMPVKPVDHQIEPSGSGTIPIPFGVVSRRNQEGVIGVRKDLDRIVLVPALLEGRLDSASALLGRRALIRFPEDSQHRESSLL